MATTDIDGAHVFPEDQGTDAPSDYNQPDSAGFFGGLVRHEALLDYVAGGLDFNVDFANNSVDITSGVAFLLVDNSVSVQNQDGEYVETWRSGIGIVVDVPGMTGLSLTSGATNHVFLAVDMTQGDGAYYEINTTDEQPTDPYLKIGTIDTETEETTLLNRDSDLGDEWEHANDTNNPHEVTNDQVGAPSDSEFSSLETDVSTLETDLSDHETGGNHDQLSGAVVGRSEPVTHFEGNVWHLQEGDPLPDAAEPGDTVIRY